MLSVPQIHPVSDLQNNFSAIAQSEVYLKLKEAEIQAESTTKRYSHAEVMDRLQAIIAGETGHEND
jgi:hypothetical protein